MDPDSRTTICKALVADVAERCRAQRVLVILEEKGGPRVVAHRLPALEDGNALLRAIEPWLLDARRTGSTRLRHGPRVARQDQRSCLVVPLQSGRKYLGAVYADIEGHLGRFGGAELSAVAGIARDAATALTRASAIDAAGIRLQQRTNELSAICRIQQGLAELRDVQAAIRLVGDQLREALCAGLVEIALLDRERALLNASYVFDQERHPLASPWTPTGVADRVVREAVPLRLDTPESLVCVPLMVAGQAIGFIAVGKPLARSFRDSDLDLVVTIAASLSVALEAARLLDEKQQLLEEARQQRAELEVVMGIQQGLTAGLDLDAIVERVGQTLGDAFGTDSIGIAIAWFDEDSMQARPVYVREKGMRLPRIAPFTAKPTHANSRMLREHTTVVVNQVDSASHAVVPGTQLPRSYMRAPVLAGERVIGIVNIENFERADAFSDADARLLGVVANALGAALQTARVLDENRRLKRENEHRHSHMAVINEIQQGMAERPDIQSCCRLASEKLVEVLGASLVMIWLWDEALEQIRECFVFDVGRQTPPGGLVYPTSALGPPGHLVLVQRKSFAAGNWAEQDALGVTCMPGSPRNSTVASAPLLGSQRVWGLLIVEDRSEHAIDPSELRFLEAVGVTLGVALEKACQTAAGQ